MHRGRQNRPTKIVLRAALLLIFGPACQSVTIACRVVGVTVGDRIAVLDDTNTQHKIRLG